MPKEKGQNYLSPVLLRASSRKLSIVKVLSWPHAEGHVQSAKSQFFPRIIFNSFIDVLYIHQVV